MSHLLKLSEAASMALHTAAILSARPGELVSTRTLASILGGSEAHLSKVLQRLVKGGLVKSVRGPRGGFTLARDPGEITLLEVYELMEGPLTPTACLLGEPICGGECLLGGLLADVDIRAKEYLSNKTLADFSQAFKGAGHDGKSA